MFRLIKVFFSFLWKIRKVSFLIFFLTALFFSLRFPWNHFLEKMVRNIQKQSPNSFQMDFDKVRFLFLPPGVKFENLFFNYTNKRMSIQSVEVSLPFSYWLAFKKALRIQMFQNESSLSLIFWKKESNVKEESLSPLDIYSIKGSSPSLDLKILNPLFPNMDMSGKIQLIFDYKGPKNQIEKALAEFYLSGSNVNLSKTELSTPMGPLNLPSILWGTVEVDFYLKEGELVLKSFRLGSPSDKLIVEMKGSSALSISYGRVRLNSYDLQLKIDADKSFPMNLLDLMFAGYKEDKGSFYRYILRMTGRGNQVPQMEKLTEF